jgi:hypothetical protein
MAKRRTKKEKTRVKRAPMPFKLSLAPEPKAPEKVVKEAPSLFDYDAGLIRYDLIKTVVIASLILSLEIALYYYFMA